MSDFTTNNQPGFHTQRSSDEKQVWWSGRGGQTLIATRQVTIGSTSQDSGSTPVTTLRAGLVMGLNSSTGKAYPYDPDAIDGTQIPFGILERAVNMLVDGTATTLKRLLYREGRPILHPENRRYADIVPETGLECQGVLVGLIRPAMG